jgi:hypothetical protein
MAEALKSLTVPFFLGAGGDLRLVNEQFIEPLHGYGYRGSFDAFLCNGPTRYRCEIADTVSTQLIRGFEMREHLGTAGFNDLLRVCEETLNREEFRLPPPMRVIGERIVDRVSMINVAPIGRPLERLNAESHANRDAFCVHDKKTGYRRRFMAHLNSELSHLSAKGLFISLGGETSFDIVINGNDKSYPMQTLIDEGFDRVWYVGDALFAGGNDEAVLKFIERWRGPGACPAEAIPVKSWRETAGIFDKLGIIRR